MAFDPLKWGDAVEKYIGKRWGRLLIRLAILAFLLGVIATGSILFFRDFVGDVVWPFLTQLFGFTSTGITLDNIEAIIIVLTAAIVFFVLVFAVFLYVLAGAFRRRTVPQNIIDDLAEFRSQGISILNKTLAGAGTLNANVKDDYVEFVWRPAWSDWGDNVADFLGEYFTTAEKLSFSRLGVIQQIGFANAINGSHGHYLMQLSKQLTTLENLIDRYQERR